MRKAADSNMVRGIGTQLPAICTPLLRPMISRGGVLLRRACQRLIRNRERVISRDELIATVERFGGGRASKRVASATHQGDDAVFDERAALSYSGGDRRLLKNAIKLFRSDYPSALFRIDRIKLSMTVASEVAQLGKRCCC